MFSSPILDLVILLSFTYFVGSLMLSTILESFAGMLKTRGRGLKASLLNLLIDPAWTSFVEKYLLKSQYLLSLMDSKTIAKNGFPSYIPAESFFMALIEQIGVQNISLAINTVAGGTTPVVPTANYNALDAAIQASATLPRSMKDTLSGLAAKAEIESTGTDKAFFPMFKAGVEAFFNNAMDRATGSYKRKTRKWQLVVGFLLAASVNIDTIEIIQDGLSDKAQMAQTVDKIVAAMPQISKNDSLFVIKNGVETLAFSRTETFSDSAKVDSSGTNTVDSSSIDFKKIEQLKMYYNQISSSPMGYADSKQFWREWIGRDALCSKDNAQVSGAATTTVGSSGNENRGWLSTFIIKLFGILFTAFALQLGSNYWFDMLNKFVNLRATGKKPEEKKVN